MPEYPYTGIGLGSGRWSSEEWMDTNLERDAWRASVNDVGHLLDEVIALRGALAEAQEREQRVRAMMGRALADIQAQREANHIRWGDMSIENRPPDYVGWLPTLGEEFGEVCRALCLEGERDRLRPELIDLVAVGLMWLDSIDRAALGGGS
jgi:hypothetical protein